jgi:hypothetical protein
MAEICDGAYFLPPASTQASPLSPSRSCKGTSFLSFSTGRVVIAAADQALDGEERVFRVGDRLALGRLADKRSPSSVNATMDGVVRAPSAFSITLPRGSLPSMTATQELVANPEVDIR